MRIAIVGGIFGKSPQYRAVHQTTPETTLAKGLAEMGHEISTFGHGQHFHLDNVDIVHVHHLSYGAVLAATDPSSAPLVFTLHRSSTGAGSRAAALRFVIGRSDAIVSLSQTESAWLQQTFGVASRTIPNGIDPAAFPFSQPSSPADERWRLLFVGQLNPLKGVNVLMKALARVAHSRDVTLDLVFHTASAESEMRRLAESLNLRSRIRFLGPIAQDRLGEVYRGANMLVLPTLASFGEQLPSVVTEAMLSGLPVVASEVGSVREQLDGAGILVPPGDPSALADGIELMIKDYDEHSLRAISSRASALSRFSVQRMVRAHEGLYQELSASGATPRRHANGRLVRAAVWRGVTTGWFSWRRFSAPALGLPKHFGGRSSWRSSGT